MSDHASHLAAAFAHTAAPSVSLLMSQVKHHIASGLRAADQDATRIRLVAWLGDIVHLTFDERAHAGVTDTRSTTEIRTQTPGFRKIEYVFRGHVPVGADTRAGKGHAPAFISR